MAGTIKGIIVEIGGDTSGLQKALKNVNSATSSLSKELRGVNSLLKLDPKNTELLSQKQTILSQNIQKTSEKLRILKQTQEQADSAIANGTKVSDENYRNLQREIINTENKLKDLQLQASKWTQAGKAIEEYGSKIQSLGKKIDDVGNKLTTRLTLPIVALGAAGIQSAAKQEAAMQQVELIYGDAADSVKDFAENTAIAYNMSTSEAYKYSQIYGNLIQSITDDEEENALYTQQLLKASSVIASATGRTMEDVMDRIRSGLLGNTEAIEDLGVNVNVSLLESTDAFKKFAGDKSWNQLDFQTQQQIRLFGILEQTTKKYGNEVNKNTSSDIQRVTAKFKNLTSQLNKKLLPIAEKLINKAEDFIDKLDDLTDEEQENIIKIGLFVAAAGPLVKILGATTTTVGNVTKGLGLFSQAIGVATGKTTSNVTSVNNLARGIQILTNPLTLATIGVTALTVAIVDSNKEIMEFAEDMKEQKQALEDYYKSIDETTDANLSHIESVEKLKDELKKLVDENGKVKEGYESRVSFILNELNEALGTEYKLNGNIIDSYKKLQDEIDELVEKKEAEIILSSREEKYRNAIENQAEAVNNLKTATQTLQETQDKYNMTLDELRDKVKEVKEDIGKVGNVEASESWLTDWMAVDKVIQAYDDAEFAVKEYTEACKNYERDYTLFIEEKYSEISNTVTTSTQDWCDTSLETIKQSILEQSSNLEIYKSIYKSTGNEVAEENQKQAQENLQTLADELASRTSTIKELSQAEIDAWTTLSTEAHEVYEKELGKMPDDVRQKIEEAVNVLENDESMYLRNIKSSRRSRKRV